MMGEVEELKEVFSIGKEILLQGISKDLKDGVWYLDMDASNHMIGKRSFFYEIDDTYFGTMKFEDDSRIAIKGKGGIFLNSLHGKSVSLIDILYTPKL